MRPSALSRRLTIVAAVAIAIACGLSASRLRFTGDLTRALPDNDPVMNEFRVILAEFKALDLLTIDFGMEETSDASRQRLVDAADAHIARLRSSGLFSQIIYHGRSDQMQPLLDALQQAAPNLLSEAELAEVTQSLTSEEISRRLSATRRTLLDPAGPFLRARAQRDPLSLTQPVFDQLRGLQPGAADRAKLVDGRLWSADERHLLAIAVPSFSSLDSTQSAALVALLDVAAADARSAAGDTRIEIIAFGGHLIALDNEQALRRDIARALTLISVALFVLGVGLFHRRLFAVLLLVPASFGLLFALGVTAIFTPQISGIALGCAAVLIGVAVDYGVHLLCRQDRFDPAGDSPLRTVRALALPLAAAAGTTVAAFLSMLLSPVPDQRQIGLLAALGVAGAAVFSVAVLPLLIPRVARAPQRTVIPLMRIASAFLTLRIRQGAFFLIAAALLLAASVFGLTRLEFDGDPRNLNLFLEERRQDEEQLRARWGDASPVSVVVRGETFEEALQANDRLNAALGAMRARGEIDSITSIASILPADLTQSTNQERWRAHWTPQRVDALRAAMEPSTRALGFTPDAFAPFFEWLTATPPSLDRSAFEGTPLGDLITSRVAHSGDAHLILTTFVPSRAEDVDALTARVRTVDPTVAVLAPDQFIDLAQDLAARELLLLALWSGIATTLALALFLRRPRLVLAALVPLMAGVVITLGLLGLLGIPVTMVSCLFIVFVFGVGIDYTIFMLTGLLASRRAGQSMNAQSHAAIAAGSVMLCGCTTLLGFTSLTVGSHPALFSIGTTGLLGIGANLACALVLVPALTGMAAGRAN